MKTQFDLQSIGQVIANQGTAVIEIEPQFRSGLTNIEGFEYLQVVWWGHLFDSPAHRDASLLIDQPYKHSPEQLGVFATRSQIRPNPILISTIQVLGIDNETGKITTPYLDAEVGSQILDLKPYHLMERVDQCIVPAWCAHWPASYEKAADFDWPNEFNF